MQRHGDDIAERYTMADVEALFGAYGRLNGVNVQSERLADEDEVAAFEALKANWHGVKA